MLGADKKESKRQMGWRLDTDVAEYLETQGEKMGRGGQTVLVENSIRLYRALSEVLSGHGSRLQKYAAENALNLREHESAIISRLVLAGLEAYEKKKR